MEEINLKEIYQYFVKNVGNIAIITLLFCIIGVIYTGYIQTPRYSSSTTLLLTKTADSSETITQGDLALYQKLITTYREIIKSNKVLKQVIKELELDYTVDELSNNISVSSVKDTEIIEIAVSNVDKRLACDIANKIAAIFSKEVVSLYKIQNIGIIDAAEVSNSPYNVSIIKQVLLATVAGFLISLVVLFIRYYFDTTVKSVEQIENVLGIPVIGMVPKRNKGGKRK